MKFIVGGYYLIQGTQLTWVDANIINTHIFWSVSKCICEIYPGVWVFPGSSEDETLKRKRDILQLSKSEFAALQTRFNKFHQDGKFGFPNVFFSVDLAKDFYTQYLRRLPHIKLISIAIPETYLTELANSKDNKFVRLAGVDKKLKEHQQLEPDALFRGFEILGHDYASFCSFVCNRLEIEYHTKLGIKFNSNSLINTFEEAVKAANYTMLDDVPAEPLFWCPWLESEYPLN